MSELSGINALYVGEAYQGHVIYTQEQVQNEQLPAIRQALCTVLGSTIEVRYDERRGMKSLVASEPEDAPRASKPARRQALTEALSPRYRYKGAASVRCRADLTGEHAATHVKITVSSDESTVTTVPEVGSDTFLSIPGIVGGIVVPRMLKNPGHIGAGPYDDGYVLAALNEEMGRADDGLLERGTLVARSLAEIAGIYVPDFNIAKKIFHDDPLPIVGAYGHARA